MPVAPGEELLPETRRALLRRVAAGQADGRAPSVTAGVVRDGTVDHLDVGTFVFTREPYPPDAPAAAQPDPDGWRPG